MTAELGQNGHNSGNENKIKKNSLLYILRYWIETDGILINIIKPSTKGIYTGPFNGIGNKGTTKACESTKRYGY